MIKHAIYMSEREMLERVQSWIRSILPSVPPELIIGGDGITPLWYMLDGLDTEIAIVLLRESKNIKVIVER